MNRRGFFAMLSGAVLDPERLLWVPGKKLISIPAALRPLRSDDLDWTVVMDEPLGMSTLTELARADLWEVQRWFNRLNSQRMETDRLARNPFPGSATPEAFA